MIKVAVFMVVPMLSAWMCLGSIAEPINDKCPVMKGEVDKDSPTAMYKGHVIGFCCAGCEGKWEALPDSEKLAFIRMYRTPTGKSGTQQPMPDVEMEPAALARNPAVTVARAYLAACGKADAKELNALFLDRGRATVSENADDEGTWERYRDHHLLPELKSMGGLAMDVTKEDVQTFGMTSIVRQIGSFTVSDPNHKNLRRKFGLAATFVVVDDSGKLKIAHLHWSSRDVESSEGTKPENTHGQHGQ